MVQALQSPEMCGLTICPMLRMAVLFHRHRWIRRVWLRLTLTQMPQLLTHPLAVGHPLRKRDTELTAYWMRVKRCCLTLTESCRLAIHG